MRTDTIEPSEVERDRRRFVDLWRHRHSGLRTAVAVKMLLESPRSRDVARRWIDEAIAEEAVRSARETAARDACRAALSGVSRLLVRACASEGLSLAAVAHGILGTTSVPEDTEGFPWTDRTSAEAAESTRAGTRALSLDRWESRHFRDAAFVRPRVHPMGGWAVRQRNGILHVDLAIGAHRLRTSSRGGVLYLAHAFPETVLAAMPGRRLSAVVDDPVLRDPDFVIASTASQGSSTLVRFECPKERVAIGDLAPERGTERQQLGRDGRLSGEEAMADVIARGGDRLSRRIRPTPEMISDVLSGGAEAERVRRIDLMCPPWGEPLRRG